MGLGDGRGDGPDPQERRFLRHAPNPDARYSAMLGLIVKDWHVRDLRWSPSGHVEHREPDGSWVRFAPFVVTPLVMPQHRRPNRNDRFGKRPHRESRR